MFILSLLFFMSMMCSSDNLQMLCIKKIVNDHTIARQFLNSHFNNSDIISEENTDTLRKLITQKSDLLNCIYKNAQVTKTLKPGYLSINQAGNRIAVCTYPDLDESFEYRTYIYNDDGKLTEILDGHRAELIQFDYIAKKNYIISTDKKYTNIFISLKHAQNIEAFCTKHMPLKQILLLSCLQNAYQQKCCLSLTAQEKDIYSGFLPEIKNITDPYVYTSWLSEFKLKVLNFAQKK